MVRLVSPSNHVWLSNRVESSLPNNKFTHRIHPNQALQFSIRIQDAYEQVKPLLIISDGSRGLCQFCGYVERVDPEERWIQLVNGSIKKRISLQQAIQIEVIT